MHSLCRRAAAAGLQQPQPRRALGRCPCAVPTLLPPWQRLQQRRRRAFSEAAIPEGVQVVMLPKLSPSMETGRVRWLKQPGDRIEQYDLLFEVETTTLLSKGMAVHEGAPVVLEVEAQDEGVLARVDNDPGTGAEIAAGTPLGVISDDDDEAAVAAARAFDPGSRNIYDNAQLLERAFLWQAYAKKESPEGSGGGGAGSGAVAD